MKTPTKKTAFTLIELLVVVAILALLTVVVIPSVAQIFSQALTQGGLNLTSTLLLARQTAITQNQATEVRFYQYADPTNPGEVAGNPGSGKYRAFQVFKISDSGSVTAIDTIQLLPAGIIIDSGALSSLLLPSQAKTWTTLDPQLALPGIGIGYNCMVFRFHADGSTNLSSPPPSPPGAWCVTLHRLVLGDNLPTPPNNFITLDVDPISGKVSTFHP